MRRKKSQQYEDQIINDLKGLLAIESVRDDAKASEDAPVGPGPRKALDYMYEIARQMDLQHMMWIILQEELRQVKEMTY